jgi:hypothetical protein
MIRTKKQNMAFHALIGKIGIDKETKRDMILGMTNMRTSSSKDLTSDECQALINALRVKSGLKPDKVQDDPADKMRKKILSICHEMHWTVNGKVDWRRLDTWLKQYGMYHKSLNKLTLVELPSQLTQFEQLLKSFYAKEKI